MNQKEKEAEKMKNNLEIKEEEISSLTLSLEAQQKMIAENETELRTLKHDLVRAENMSDKVENLQLKLSAQGTFFCEMVRERPLMMSDVRGDEGVLKYVPPKIGR